MSTPSHSKQLKSSQKKSLATVFTCQPRSPYYPTPWLELDTVPATIWSNASLSQPPWDHVWELPRLAVIGSRQSSDYAAAITKQFVTTLVKSLGVVVVSGCARGVDSIAHQAALQAGGLTIGILGGGLQHITYRQRQLFSSSDSLLISEFAPTTTPYKANFVRRNRLISASADAILVVEAGARSGTLITVKYALDQGKDVYVIPQSLWNLNYQGVCDLVNQGAYLTTSPQQLAREVWGLGAPNEQICQQSSYQQQILRQAQSPSQKDILQLLLENQGRLLRSELISRLPDALPALQTLQREGLVNNTFGVLTLSV